MKIALLFAFRKSEWKSCVSITSNLRQAYSALGEENIQSFDYDHLKGELHLELMADQLKAFAPDRIVFLDHRPTPKHLLERLIKRDLNVPLIIHLYGDFSVYCNEWLEQEALLKYFKVQFVVASSKQKKIVSQFLNQSDQVITKIPFSIDTHTFQYNENFAKKFSNDYKLRNQDINFIYAGRITKQKNIIALADIFKNEIAKANPNSKLFIAGDPDDTGSPFHGEYEAPGTTQLYLEKHLGAKVQWVGSLSKDELVGAYSACDAFISLSTFHDEDFGMAPAEAACCGASLILTDWGGYTDFLNQSHNSSTIGLSIDASARFHFQREQVVQALLAQKKINPAERKLQIEKFKGPFDIQTTSQLIQSLIKSKELTQFEGFNRKFWIFTDCFRKRPSSPFFDPDDENENKKIQYIYQEAYNAYAS